MRMTEMLRMMMMMMVMVMILMMMMRRTIITWFRWRMYEAD